MLIICNYFDISNHIGDTDIIIENCEDFYPELAGYSVICKEFRIQDVIDWIVNNTGSNANRFEKQLKIDSSKALNMLKLQFKIESYTKEIVDNLGGIDKYKEILLANQPASVFGEDVTETESAVDSADFSLQNVESFLDTPTESNIIFEEDNVSDTESIISDLKNVEVDNNVDTENNNEIKNSEEMVGDAAMPEVSDSFSEMSDTLDFLGESVATSNTVSALEAYSVKDKHNAVESVVNTQKQRNTCVCDCIYNSDGSFKGFTEGQILKLLNELRELDNRIALDDLNPDYVMSTEELQMAVEKLEDFSPAVFKAFFIRSAQGATTETERIRCSQLIDQFINFLQSLNKG